MDDTLKTHLFYNGLTLLLGGLVVLFGYLCVVMVSEGLRELSMGNPIAFGAGVFLGGGYMFAAALQAYFLIAVIKAYLDERTLIVPDTYPECRERIHPSDVKWIEGDKAECPHCGLELSVTKEW